MKKTITSSILSLLLSFALCLSLLPGMAYAVTQDEIDDLAAQRDAIAEKVAEKQKVVDELKDQHASVVEQKHAMDERNEYTLQQIKLNDEQIALYDELIAEKAKEVDEAKALEDEQLARYRVRVRAMEENGNYDILALILNTTSLGELLTAVDDIGEIMAADRALEEAYIAARKNTEQVKADYEAYRDGLEEKKTELLAQQEELQAQIEEANQLISDILKNLSGESDELDELMRAEDQAQAVIDQKIAELEEQRRREEEAKKATQGGGSSGGGSGSSGGSVVGSGSFGWPVGSTYITSVVGYRWHPISGEWKYHSGMDIAASTGDSVFASDSGTVILASWNGGYGNCVMIDHGNGYVTLYGHLSSIGVSEGQSVSKGAYIGGVGSTGNSTGPHLHFEIRQGGGAIDFNGWFGGLTYAPDSGG